MKKDYGLWTTGKRNSANWQREKKNTWKSNGALFETLSKVPGRKSRALW